MSELAKLRNGTEVPAALVPTVMLSLDLLLEKAPVALYELVMKCRDPEHVIFGNCGDKITDVGLLEGDGFDMRLRDPLEVTS